METRDTDITALYLNNLTKTLSDPDEQRKLLIRIKNNDQEATEQFIEGNLKLVVSIAMKYQGRGLDLLDLIQEGNIGLMKAIEKYDLTRENRFSTYATWWIKQSITRALLDQSDTIRKPVHFSETLNKIKRIKAYLLQKNGIEPTNKEIAKALNISEKQLEEIYTLNPKQISLNISPFNEREDSSSNQQNELSDYIAADEGNPEEELINSSLKEVLNDLMDKCLTEKEKNIIKLRFGFSGQEVMTLGEVGKKYGVTRERIRQIEHKALQKLKNCGQINALTDYAPQKTLKLQNKKK